MQTISLLGLTQYHLIFFRNRQLVAKYVNSPGQYHQMTRHHQGKFLLITAIVHMYLSHVARGNSYNKLYGGNDSVKY